MRHVVILLALIAGCSKKPSVDWKQGLASLGTLKDAVCKCADQACYERATSTWLAQRDSLEASGPAPAEAARAMSAQADEMLACANARVTADMDRDRKYSCSAELEQTFQRIAGQAASAAGEADSNAVMTRGLALARDMRARCKEQSWPAETIHCVIDASSLDDVRGCAQSLPSEHAQAFSTAMDQTYPQG